MRSVIVTIFLGLGAALGGCSQSQPATGERTPPPLLVPSAAIIQRANRPMPALAWTVLPASDGDYDFPRGEKAVYGSFSLGDVSAYTLYTMDAQRISDSPGSVGYQYRWVIQQGIAAPLSP